MRSGYKIFWIDEAKRNLENTVLLLEQNWKTEAILKTKFQEPQKAKTKVKLEPLTTTTVFFWDESDSFFLSKQ